ncbi:hypothetical protein TSUD_58250 [Trifolium subterraneum]|uniref:Uncharacterized protein n=1 Tax=Trifolium subterraneum TaxID=3900 RepID=A0A2Z6MGY1_TRISU|nr:hypothetical protein TSUD_58250 [Trifolium subterraneum]
MSGFGFTANPQLNTMTSHQPNHSKPDRQGHNRSDDTADQPCNETMEGQNDVTMERKHGGRTSQRRNDRIYGGCFNF